MNVQTVLLLAFAGTLISSAFFVQAEAGCAKIDFTDITPVPLFSKRDKKTGERWWARRFVDHLEQIDKMGGRVDLVFCGDSITHNWENSQGRESYEQITNAYSVLNLGYGGDGVQHLLWRLKNGELDGYEAKCIMLMVGTNYGDTPPEIRAKGIRQALDIIASKQPQAKILLLPIFPRGEGPMNDRRKGNDKVNDIIRTYADGDRIVWLDFTEKFLDKNGDTKWIMPDRLHPNATGYRYWKEAVMPYFRKIVGHGERQ